MVFINLGAGFIRAIKQHSRNLSIFVRKRKHNY